MNILSIDQGTTSTRAFLVDRSGEMTPLASRTHHQAYPGPGRVEHDAEELLGDIRACLEAAAAHGDVAAVGLDNQGESCLAWDAETGVPLSPVIVWQDDRTASVTDGLRRDGAEGVVRARAGLPLDPYFSASKLAWIVHNLPAAADALSHGRLRLGTTDAFFRDRLTGRFQTDVTTASRTSLMNLATGAWDEDLCRIFDVPMHALPEITPCAGDLGIIRHNGRDLRLGASLVDQQAALYGHGCRQAGDAKITFGTGAFALVVTGGVVCNGAALPTIAWRKAGGPVVHALDGGVYSASSAVNWARDLGLFHDFDEIATFARPSAALDGLIFVPALAGLACPHWNRQARGAWMGLSHQTSRQDMMQAVLEGIAFRMAEVIDELDRHVAITGPISIDGGLSANRWFCQILSDTLGREVLVSDTPELTALGTAQMAAEGIGASIPPRRGGTTIHPRPLPDAARTTFARARHAVEAFGETFGQTPA